MAGRALIDQIRDDVVQLERVRNTDQPTRLHFDWHRLVVVEQIARVENPVLGEQIHRPDVVRQRRPEPARDRLSRPLADRFDRILDDRAFLFDRHPVHVTRVVDAVGIELPVALRALLDDFRVVIAHGDVQRHRAAHAAFVHRVHHAPPAGAVAVVAIRILEHVR
jgi:hypothetical protein